VLSARAAFTYPRTIGSSRGNSPVKSSRGCFVHLAIAPFFVRRRGIAVEGDIIGFVASGLVLATFAMKDMRRLRATAILSNLAFIAYGLLFGLLPVLLLHLVLLPLNLFRLAQGSRPAPGAAAPNKATLLAIEALHFAGTTRPDVELQSGRTWSPERRTRPSQPSYSR
jgi:hypothetical protein